MLNKQYILNILLSKNSLNQYENNMYFYGEKCLYKVLKKEIQKNKVKGSFPWTYYIDIYV